MHTNIASESLSTLNRLRADAVTVWQSDVPLNRKLLYMSSLKAQLGIDFDDDSLYALTLSLDALTSVMRFQKDPHIASHLGENTAQHSILTTLDIEENLFSRRRGARWKWLRRLAHLSCLTHDFGEAVTEFASFGRSVQMDIKDSKELEDAIARRVLGLAFIARWRNDDSLFYSNIKAMRTIIGIKGKEVVDDPVVAQNTLVHYLQSPLNTVICDLSLAEEKDLEHSLGVDAGGNFIAGAEGGLMSYYRTAEGLFGATGPIVKAAQVANGSDKFIELLVESIADGEAISYALASAKRTLAGPARNEAYLPAIARQTQPNNIEQRQLNPELQELGEAAIRWVYACSLRLVMHHPEVVMRDLRVPDPDPTKDMALRLRMNDNLARLAAAERTVCGDIHQHKFGTKTLLAREVMLAYLAITVCDKLPLQSGEFKSGQPLIAWSNLPDPLPVYVRLLDQFDTMALNTERPSRDWLVLPVQDGLSASQEGELQEAADRIWRQRSHVIRSLRQFHLTRRMYTSPSGHL